MGLQAQRVSPGQQEFLDQKVIQDRRVNREQLELLVQPEEPEIPAL